MDSYVALGSSSTCGAGSSDPATKGYVALLGRGLEEQFPGLEIHNLGRSDGRLGDVMAHWADVAEARPSIITVLPFTDFAKTPVEALAQEAAALVQAATELAEERIREGGLCHLFFGDLRIDPTYVAGAKETPDGPRYRPRDYAMLSEKNEAVAKAAAHASAVTLVPVIDQNAIHPEWVGPGGHPNDLGHGYLAGCFRKAIDKWWRGVTGR